MQSFSPGLDTKSETDRATCEEARPFGRKIDREDASAEPGAWQPDNSGRGARRVMVYGRYSEAQFVAACEGAAPSDEHGDLLNRINGFAGNTPFHHVLTRTGWHRLGGVVTADGARVADSLRKWAEDESGGDMFALYESHADAGLATTRFDGKMHYFVAPLGAGSRDFLQLEVEELVEVVDRPLFVDDQIPDDIEELCDPPGALEARFDAEILTPARYGFHAATDIGELVARDSAGGPSDRRYIRLLREWEATSAAGSRFSDHFVLRLFPFLDRFGEHKIEATPLPVRALPEPSPDNRELSGAELASFLIGYNERAGFSMAWYFMMLIQKKELVGLAQAAYLDHQTGYRYLADADLAVLENWIREPYNF